MRHATTLRLFAAIAMTGGAVLAGSIPARASVEIRLSSGGQTWSQIGSSPLSIAHSIGHFATSIDLGVASGAPFLDLTSANLQTSAAGSLVIAFSEDNLTAPIGLENWFTSLIGTFDSLSHVTVSVQSYLSANDTLLGTGIPLCSVSSQSTPYDVSCTAPGRTTGPFALTEIVTVTAAGSAVTAFNASVSLVPEPASLGLLGTALFGLGMVARRRRRRD